MNLQDLLAALQGPGPGMPPRKPWQVSPMGARATPDELAAGMRRAAQPTQQPLPPTPGLLARLQNGLMPAPDGAVQSGLLSQGDVSQAQSQGLLGIGAGLLANAGPKIASERVPFMSAVAQGIQGGQNQYREALQGAMGLHAAGRKAQSEQMELDQEKKKQAILAGIPMPSDNTPDALIPWLDQAVPALTKAGLVDEAAKLGTMRKALEKEKVQQAQTGDLDTTFDPNHPEAPFWDPTANGGQGGRVKSVERHMPADQLALKQAQLEALIARGEAAQSAASNGRMDRLAKVYDTHVKPMTDRVQPINQALMALDAARTSPVVGANAIVAFMTAVDPKATQRYQMVNWISSHLSPSMKAKAIRMLDEKTTGLLPPDMLAEMTAHVKRTRDSLLKQEERTFNEFVKIHPEMKGDLTRLSAAFEPDAPTDAPPAAATPGGGKRQWKTADGTVIYLP